MSILETVENVMFDGSLKIYAQPQFDITSGKLCRYEALLRFPLKFEYEGGPKTTAEWIKAIQEAGGLRTLTNWILVKIASFFKDNKDHPPISINVSPIIVDESFVTSVTDIFDRYNVNLSKLGLEITEDCEPESFKSFNKIIKKLRSLSVYIALDDFGSGYSTMKFLMHSEVDAVKIDKVFIQHAATEAGSIVMSALIHAVKGFCLKIICEGIETESHLSLAKEFHVDSVQGFLLGYPKFLT